MNYTKHKAFTLVELIVVITILAILGTIAFISLQGFSKDARESARLNDVRLIEKKLGLYKLREGIVPFPDDSIDITGSGSLFGKQGYASTRVLATIGQAGNIVDPLLDVPYTYYVNSNRTQFQLLAYFEENQLAFNELNILNTAHANTTYADLFPRSFGSSLGVLINFNNEPVQIDTSLGGELDLVNISDGVYTLLVDNTTSLKDKDSILIYQTIRDKNVSGIDETLIGFWDMKTLYQSGSINYLQDFSRYGNHGICTETHDGDLGCNQGNGGPSIDGDTGTYFDGINDHLNIGTFVSDVTEFSLITHFNIKQGTNHNSFLGNSYTRPNGFGYYYGRSNQQKIWGIIYDSAGNQHIFRGDTIIENGKDYIATFTYKDGLAKIYLNEHLETEIIINGFLPRSTGVTSIGKQNSAFWPFHGTIHEVRIYNRELNIKEINILNKY